MSTTARRATKQDKTRYTGIYIYIYYNTRVAGIKWNDRPLDVPGAACFTHGILIFFAFSRRVGMYMHTLRLYTYVSETSPHRENSNNR